MVAAVFPMGIHMFIFSFAFRLSTFSQYGGIMRFSGGYINLLGKKTSKAVINALINWGNTYLSVLVMSSFRIALCGCKST